VPATLAPALHQLFIAQIGADVQSAGRTRRITARALARGGISREVTLDADAVNVAAVAPDEVSTIRVQCDEISFTTNGELKISGWAVGPASLDVIQVALDGVVVGKALIGLSRPDVGNQFPALPHARVSGYAFLGKTDGSWVGEHLVELLVRDARGGTFTAPLPVRAVAGRSPPPAAAEPESIQSEIRLFVDTPNLNNGRAVEPLRGSLSINGWSLAPHGVVAVDVYLDGESVGSAYYGVRREDVAAAFPNRSDALLSGFAALVPARRLSIGGHIVRILVRDRNGGSAFVDFEIEVAELPEDIGPWSLRQKMTQAEIDLQMRVLTGLNARPVFHLLLPLQETAEALESVHGTVSSLAEQSYPEWRLVVFPAGHADRLGDLTRDLLGRFGEISDRLHILATRPVGRIVDSIMDRGKALKLIGLIAPGDQLGCDALLETAIESGFHRNAELIYADERRISPVSGTFEAFFKPDWSPDLLLSMNYLGRPWFVSAKVLTRIGATYADLESFGEYDLALRCTEVARGIRHVPRVLCQRARARLDSERDEKAALKRALRRRAVKGEVLPGCVSGTYRVKREVATKGLVSIIVPTCAARGLVKTCLDTLRKKTRYRNFEIVCIENIPTSEKKWKRWLKAAADRVVSTEEPFNWSRFNNLAAAEAKGEFLLFLNDDIEIVDPHWLEALLEHATRPEVGVVGPRLLYPDHRVQHAGLFLTAAGTARHAFRFAGEDDPGYFGLALTQRNMIGVTGACLLTRRDVFDTIGRFDETHSVINNDVDYCLRVWRSGLLNVYTPHTTLIHHELASRSGIGDHYDAGAFESQWRDLFHLGDPYFHPSLSRNVDDYAPELEPLRLVCAGHPVLAKEKIRSILVLKLDHIGDCVTALPAIRRLKRHFPTAKLHILAGRGTNAIWATEPAVEEVLDFDFFHVPSALGARELTKTDLEGLRRRLKPYRFDLAVDLRKSPDTRPILQYAGARYLAGFDSDGRYPWLDISVEWEGDHKFGRKRQHVADGLLNLVEEIANQAQQSRAVIRPPDGILSPLDEAIRRRLFRKRVVCVHPGAGTPMRQWPAEYFAELIDLLVSLEGVHVAVIGGNDEQELADAILGQVRFPKSVFSFVRKIKLSELPLLLVASALYVGNNSGPKHIAAGLGVPTIGVHSGVIDSAEWGPLGPAAIALRRDMTCAPCYLTQPNQCPRGLACLTRLGPGDVYAACRRMLGIRHKKNTDAELAS
jgi:ADP-heptose:LPS heptosyltransferase/GT2 family glycosyltransferase